MCGGSTYQVRRPPCSGRRKCVSSGVADAPCPDRASWGTALAQRELGDILDPWEDPTCHGPHLLPAEPAEDFPGETFRVLKDKEERAFGEYRTRRLVLEAWGRQQPH